MTMQFEIKSFKKEDMTNQVMKFTFYFLLH